MNSNMGGLKRSKPLYEGEAALGKRVGVFWDGEDSYFYGRVVKYNDSRLKKKYLVKYEDGDKHWEYGHALNFEKGAAGASSSGKQVKPKKRPRTPPMEGELEETNVPTKKLQKTEGDEQKKAPVIEDVVPEKEENKVPSLPPVIIEKDDEPRESDNNRGESESVPPSSSISSAVSHDKPSKDASELSSEESKKKKRGPKKVVGRRCKVYWSGEGQYFMGEVIGVDRANNKLHVSYDDGDDEWEAEGDVTFIEQDNQRRLPVESKRSSEQKHDPGNKSKGIREDLASKRKDKGSESIGWHVKYISSEKTPEEKDGEVVGFQKLKNGSPRYIIAPERENPTQKLHTFAILDDETKGFIVAYLSKVEVPLLSKLLASGQFENLDILAKSGASRKIDYKGETDPFALVLKSSIKEKLETIKVLLENGFDCSITMWTRIFKQAVNQFKSKKLLHLLHSKKSILKKIRGDKLCANGLYRFCVDHIVKLNAQGKLEPVDQMVMETLSNQTLGFSLNMVVPSANASKVDENDEELMASSSSSAEESRTNVIISGTPLLHAIARGNVDMAIRLMHMERKSYKKPLSDAHWKLKFVEQFEPYVETWKLQSPLRIVLFFFIVIKSFKNLQRILKEMVKLGVADINRPELPDRKPILVFLCTLTEKKLQMRIRESMTQLFEAGADPNVKDEQGVTPLVACVKFRNARYVKLLVRDGKADTNSGSPLVEACELGYREEMDALIKCGATLGCEVFKDGQCFVSQLFKGKLDLLKQLITHMKPEESANFLNRFLIDMCYNEDVDMTMLDYVLDKGVDLSFSDQSGYMAVLVSIQGNRPSLLNRMFNKNPTKVDLTKILEPTTGQSLLVYASRMGLTEIVKVLLNHGADPMAVSGYKLRGKNLSKNALYAACETGNLDLLKVILSQKNKININEPTPRGCTCLHLASTMGSPENVKLLLKHGADADAIDEFGQTPLAWASIDGNEEIVRILLDVGKSKVNHKDVQKCTPLQLAIRHGNHRA
eukprot:CAMPEP_0203753374 /NCGR_PEP_ID=MMETSP0098-20131031/7160_1 /ASSEMBLY_ACC=CAM_ASM_000208 /TAXON_ID=96639 /ORGANISM=" , Strain NY0313808BC1" /LENGTH=1004 /DNA_ID=CAMNT_0050643947 /DNA_START=290 /DNA_END=3301 /DNA_ORIENTATION=+